MYLTGFRAENYRNIEKEEITFSPGVNLFIGENAQGKTNALEAIYTFARGKSFRGAHDAELVKFGKSYYRTDIYYQSENEKREEHLSLRYENKEKIRERNGVRLEKQSEIIGKFRAVLFCPDHMNMVKEGPGERRLFLNIAISQCYPAYLGLYTEYNKVLEQRNALLKFAQKGLYVDPAEMEVYSMHLARCSAEIYRYRWEYVKKIAPYAADIQNELSVGREKLTCFLECDLGKEECTKEEAEKKYFALFTGGVGKEIQAGYSLYGIHRDDLALFVNGKSVRDYGSQGQQRTSVLALKMAEGEVCARVVGESPVYLFDDVLSELDEGRRRVVIHGSEKRQYLLTACDKNVYQGECHTIETKDGHYVSSYR